MVRYELAIILRTVASTQLKDTFKDTAKTILEQGAILRQFNNLGERQLPYRMRAHQQWHHRGRYIVCDMEASPVSSKTILETLRQNNNTIRASLMKI